MFLDSKLHLFRNDSTGGRHDDHQDGSQPADDEDYYDTVDIGDANNSISGSLDTRLPMKPISPGNQSTYDHAAAAATF